MVTINRGLLSLLGYTLAAVAAFYAETAQADSHAFITGNRSASTSYVYFQEEVDGEYAHYKLTDKTLPTTTEDWQGSTINTSVGTEIWKFLEIEAGYSSVSMHKSSDSLDRLTGSRLHAGLRLDFNAPLFNLELGGGVQGSTLDYVNHEETSTFYGSGHYLSIGINYFLMTHLSVYTEVKSSTEHMKNTNGSGTKTAIDSDATAAGLGFRIWF